MSFYDIKRTSMAIPNEVHHLINAYCAQKNVTKTQIFTSICVALIKGDIDIKFDTNRRVRSSRSVTHTIDSVFRVEIYDKEGKLINPTPFEE